MGGPGTDLGPLPFCGVTKNLYGKKSQKAFQRAPFLGFTPENFFIAPSALHKPINFRGGARKKNRIFQTQVEFLVLNAKLQINMHRFELLLLWLQYRTPSSTTEVKISCFLMKNIFEENNNLFRIFFLFVVFVRFRSRFKDTFAKAYFTVRRLKINDEFKKITSCSNKKVKKRKQK